MSEWQTNPDWQQPPLTEAEIQKLSDLIKHGAAGPFGLKAGKSVLLDTYYDMALAAGFKVMKMSPSPSTPRPEEHIGFMSAADVEQVRAALRRAAT